VNIVFKPVFYGNDLVTIRKYVDGKWKGVIHLSPRETDLFKTEWTQAGSKIQLLSALAEKYYYGYCTGIKG